MDTSDDEEFERVLTDARRRQHRPRAPVRIANIMNHLLARRGYAQQQQGFQWQAAWSNAVGDRLSKNSRVGRMNRGVLEITACNSAVLQELTFQKRKLLKKLQTVAGADNLRDLRFRIGEID